jgi:ABC-type nickel/cobalt efflux system permease component RcnA
MRSGRAKALSICFYGVAVVVLIVSTSAHAATSPFGIATPDSTGGFGGPLAPVFGWIALRQAEFYRTLTGALSNMKDDGHAVWLLLLVSFIYGVFHAAGPGHGKAVISAYVVSSGETVRRSVLISFASAFVQAFTAIAIVAVAAIVFQVTAQSMTQATEWIEIASYALIALVGAWLLWSKTFGGGHHHHHHHHEHDEHGGHDHTCEAAAVVPPQAKSGVAAAWSAIVAVGIRPCSGAIIVLVFALAQGLFLAGVAATLVMALGTGLTVAALATLAVSARGVALRLAGTQSTFATVLIKTVEILAALAVLLFGLLLLGGALAGGLPG